MAIGRFIAGVGALIWDSEREAYLFLRRSQEKDYAPGIWECVTGRLEQGEGFEEAVYREVKEELDVDIVLRYLLGTTHFYRGGKRPEVELVGIVYGCDLAPGAEPRLSLEHSESQWVSAEQAHQMLSADNPSENWLLRVIERDTIMRKVMPPTLVDTYGMTGFELDVF